MMSGKNYVIYFIYLEIGVDLPGWAGGFENQFSKDVDLIDVVSIRLAKSKRKTEHCREKKGGTSYRLFHLSHLS
jgi:hypothetical protein